MKIPFGVKFIAGLQIATALSFIIEPILFFTRINKTSSLDFIILMLILSLFFGVLGVSLWQLKAWARIISIITLLILSLIFLFRIHTNIDTFNSIGNFVLLTIATIYLISNENVKKAFNQTTK